MKTDTQRLDWLESKPGLALLNDDNGHWAVSKDGIQDNLLVGSSIDMRISFFVYKKEWCNSAREAIDRAMEEEKKDG